jgi:hypothetical protein
MPGAATEDEAGRPRRLAKNRPESKCRNLALNNEILPAAISTMAILRGRLDTLLRD